MPPNTVEDGLHHVRDSMPDVAGLDDLLTYFDQTYLRSTFRRVRSSSKPTADADAAHVAAVPAASMERV